MSVLVGERGSVMNKAPKYNCWTLSQDVSISKSKFGECSKFMNNAEGTEAFWRSIFRRLSYGSLSSSFHFLWKRSFCFCRYLVDPASSHMLVSKIKPCMSKYKQIILWNCEWLIKSVIVYLIISYYMDNRSNSRANTCTKTRLSWKGCIY